MADLSGPNRSSGSWLYESGWSQIVQKRVPMGVIAMIFEEPVPMSQSMPLALPLKPIMPSFFVGGRDAINSNKALVTVARKALENAGITADAVQLVEDTSHEVAENSWRRPSM